MNSRLSLRVQIAALAVGFGVLLGNPVVAIEPANIQAGPFFVTPTLDVELGYLDNLFRTATNEKDTGFSLIRPRVQAWLESGLNTYSFTYQLADYRYFQSSDDDFTDNIFNLDLHQEFNARNEGNLFLEFYDGHEDRGTGVTELNVALTDAPVELERTIYGGDYTYGNGQSAGRVKLAARGTDHNYQNFDSFTRYRSREYFDYVGTFFWKVAPRTDVLVEARFIDTQYDEINPGDAAGTLDSEEINYFVGVNWEATSKTSGSVRLGAYDRQYDSGIRGDDDGFSWEVDLSYRPLTYSHFNLESLRYSEETNGLGNAVNAKMTTLSWQHDWNNRVTTRLSLGGGEEDYTSSNRSDDVYEAEASYNYAYSRWLDISVGYQYEDRESSLGVFDYSRNQVYLEAKLGL